MSLYKIITTPTWLESSFSKLQQADEKNYCITLHWKTCVTTVPTNQISLRVVHSMPDLVEYMYL